ncbi:MAG: hypothetical protein JRJ68_09520 [Deltaproteobacteria bacterium]|nr:hypothetical protein [Deltaproteobacteria bacterium]
MFAQVMERRMAPRFGIQDSVLAITDPPSLPPATVKELSLTGLILQHRKKLKNRAPIVELSIIWIDCVISHHMNKIPIRLVSEAMIENREGDTGPFTYKQTVAFGKMQPQQKNQIEQLIRAKGFILHGDISTAGKPLSQEKEESKNQPLRASFIRKFLKQIIADTAKHLDSQNYDISKNFPFY